MNLKKAEARYKKKAGSIEGGTTLGEFFLSIEITATDTEVYIPLSIASGKKPAGFVYALEGTSRATLDTASVSVGGRGVTEVTLGTLLFARIQKGGTAVFRINIAMRGKSGASYKAIITRINYKYTPQDGRYTTFTYPLETESVRLS